MRDGFQMVARIPYPHTVPKYYAVASEAATMALLRSTGLPIPQVLACAGQRGGNRVYLHGICPRRQVRRRMG
jgi:type II secretory pathway component PulF